MSGLEEFLAIPYVGNFQAQRRIENLGLVGTWNGCDRSLFMSVVNNYVGLSSLNISQLCKRLMLEYLESKPMNVRCAQIWMCTLDFETDEERLAEMCEYYEVSGSDLFEDCRECPSLAFMNESWITMLLVHDDVWEFLANFMWQLRLPYHNILGKDIFPEEEEEEDNEL